MSNSTGFYPRLQVDTTNSGAVGQAGGVLLTETIVAAGLGPAMSGALSGWRKPLAVHDPAKVVVDLAVALALGGDCLADMALLRSEPGLYGAVTSDATVSRTITALAAHAPAVLAAIDTARAAGRAQAWKLAGAHAPNHGASARTPLIVDLDATLVGSHSEKELAAPTYKRGFGFHPLWSFVDHGAAGTGEPLLVLLRPGNAGSNTATDHIAVIKAALAQLPAHHPGRRAGRKVLIRTDGAGCTHKVLTWMSGQRLSYSVGFPLPHNTSDLLELIPAGVWTPAYDAHDQVRDGAWVAELTALLDLTGWPTGMRGQTDSELLLGLTLQAGARFAGRLLEASRGSIPTSPRHRNLGRGKACLDLIHRSRPWRRHCSPCQHPLSFQRPDPSRPRLLVSQPHSPLPRSGAVASQAQADPRSDQPG